MPRGGARKGAGRPKGSKDPHTIEREAALAALRQKVFARLEPMIDAQIAQAEGIKYLVVRDKASGKFLRVSEAMAKLSEGEERVEVWEKDPSTFAFADLWNRAAGKPVEQVSADINGALVIKWQD